VSRPLFHAHPSVQSWHNQLTMSDIVKSLNIGSDELASINRPVDIVEKIAGVKLKRKYKLDAPKGVRGRNSDNTPIKKKGHPHPSRGRIEKTTSGSTTR
jgi:hypothetical protein